MLKIVAEVQALNYSNEKKKRFNAKAKQPTLEEDSNEKMDGVLR